jgi:hypothetical protein
MSTLTPSNSKNYTNWYIAGAVLLVVVIIIIAMLSGKKTSDSGVLSLEDRQTQLENDPKLAANVNSVRNNFDPGTYSLDKNASSITWTYGETSGTMPVSGGKMTVVEKGRIGEFGITADAGDVEVTTGSNSNVQKFIGENGKKFSMNALTILPNTNDDAFTVAFTLDALGKQTSLATGMYVEKVEKGIKVSGDIYIDAKSVINPNGFPEAKDNLVLKVNYVFN